MNMFAAVGDDGFRPVVWGLGATEAEAVDDAEENLAQANAGSKLEVHRISEEQAAIVRAGDVSWTVPQSGGEE